MAYVLRHDRVTLRNRLLLAPAEPGDEPRLTIAVLAGDLREVPALRALHGTENDELLVVGSRYSVHPGAGWSHVEVPPGTPRSEMSQAALEAASGTKLALIDGVDVPDDGWIDRVRAATELPFVMVGGSFEPAHNAIADHAIHVARLWPWRSSVPAAWLAFHPAHNAVIDTKAARAVGGFVPEGALLLRLAGLGVRPVLFDPEMCVRRGRPPTARELTTAQFEPARRNTMSWSRYLDYSTPHRVVLAVVNPLRAVLRVPRRAVQAMREHRAGAKFLLSTPVGFVCNACSVAGDVVGLFSPSARQTSEPLADYPEMLAALKPDDA
jgi:hypothetical protein